LGKKEIQQTVEKIVEPVLVENDYELVDIEFIKEGKNWFLRVYIDKSDGITLDDCQFVNRELSETLDQEDPIPQSYYLEVSSPGLERPLKKESDFERFKGSKIKVKTYILINKQKKFTGILQDCKDGLVQLQLDTGDNVSIPFDKIAKANLFFDF